MGFIISERNMTLSWSPPLYSLYEYYILYCEPNCGAVQHWMDSNQSIDEVLIEKNATKIILKIEWFIDYVFTLTTVQDDLQSFETQRVNVSIGKLCICVV